jgi:single-strand DNA-binding protein
VGHEDHGLTTNENKKQNNNNMASLNKVMLMGNLTRDPETKHTPKGTAVTQLSLAINRHYVTESGDRKEEVTYVDVEAWGKLAENCAEHLSKGKSVFVEGRLKLDTWEDKQTGEKRSRMRVAADVVQFLTPKGESSQSSRPRRDF